ncbi:AAA family ATPase [Niabella sp. W65]|nr:AAA family ATPase [Niabella sp. W65]MCH7364154.1 AAA family ATPase [Niabella sp. W65]
MSPQTYTFIIHHPGRSRGVSFYIHEMPPRPYRHGRAATGSTTIATIGNAPHEVYSVLYPPKPIFVQMLRLNSISLFQFKNYTNKVFEFHKNVIGICGKNGVGKTNILDAIHYLCFTRSYFSTSDAVNVQHGSKGFRLEGRVMKAGVEETATCILRRIIRRSSSSMVKLMKSFPCILAATPAL